MMELVFATNNKNKIFEISKLLGSTIKLLSLSDIGCTEELPETNPTLEQNALQKARYVFEKYGYNCFADDTGLEIEALGGKPGVLSARYAYLNEPFGQTGENKNADDNMNKVLAEMKGVKNRNAKFRTVIALIIDGKEYFFEGAVYGKILEEKRGEKGFGYDPIFVPSLNPSPKGEGNASFSLGGKPACRQAGTEIGGELSFAQMSIEEKNKISHRAMAIKKLVEFLNKP